MLRAWAVAGLTGMFLPVGFRTRGRSSFGDPMRAPDEIVVDVLMACLAGGRAHVRVAEGSRRPGGARRDYQSAQQEQAPALNTGHEPGGPRTQRRCDGKPCSSRQGNPYSQAHAPRWAGPHDIRYKPQ